MEESFQRHIVETLLKATLQQLETGIYIDLPPQEIFNPVIVDDLLMEVDGKRMGELHRHSLGAKERKGKIFIWAESLY